MAASDFPKDQKSLGRLIVARRKKLKLTQQELAKLLKIHQGTLSRVENGAWTEQYELLLRIRNWLNVDVGKEEKSYLKAVQFRDLIREYMNARAEPADPQARDECIRVLEAVYDAFTKLKGTEEYDE
jgi:transcriptional regulator with XRE-family HTH domain